MPGTRASTLHEDRFFDSDPAIRRVARVLYEETRGLPIVSPHGHVDAETLADDSPFPEPTSLIVQPDHYILRMLYSRGIAMEDLGIAGKATEAQADPRVIWKLFASNYHLFRGTPTAAWLDYELAVVFGVRSRLDASSAARIYDEISERLASPEFRPRALFERFNIEVLATTNPASDPLAAHERLRASGWSGRVIPTFRPDAAIDLASARWKTEIEALGDITSAPILDYASLMRALTARRADFRIMGATATDHGVEVPGAGQLPYAEAERLFQRALAGQEVSPADARSFQAHMLMQMARLSTEDGLVMQLHAGALRDHNESLARSHGPHLGGDIPVATEYTRNLRPLLNEYGNDSRFQLILFTLDESTYARELAPLAGHYPAVLLGAPWWFHDSIEGMTRYREQVTETAGIWNTAGFADDTRAFCTIPARHDLSRRVDANWLAGLVARHVVDLADAHEMARALAYDLAKAAYRLDQGER